MKYTVSSIKAITEAAILGAIPNDAHEIQHIYFDTRKIKDTEHHIFWALSGEKLNGHQFIENAYEAGIRVFTIDDKSVFDEKYEDATFLHVPNTLSALQALGKYHRNEHPIPVIGITGSNGKTIVKEWLYQLIGPDIKVVKSPNSYNSQMGVPLSILQIEEQQLGIFEAGISTTQEMEKIAPIIDPTIVILTNILTAHDAGFASKEEKLKEKLKLAKNADTIIYCREHELVYAALKDNEKAISWGVSEGAFIPIEIERKGSNTIISATYNEVKTEFNVPFTDKASLENVCHCISTLLLLEYDIQSIQQRLLALKNLPMRLELKYGANSCTLIDDTYSGDIASLEIGLQFLDEQPSLKDRTLILSEFIQSGISDEDFIKKVADLATTYNIKRLIGVGELFKKYADRLNTKGFAYKAYTSTDIFEKSISHNSFNNEIILVKGARIFHFEKIVQKLELQSHRTILEINLNHLINNLKLYKQFIKDETGVVAIVKAFSYGAGSVEIASVLEKQGVASLAVAYADEGVTLRQAGIRCPIIVMNASYDDLSLLIQYQLEPEVYSLDHLLELSNRVKTRNAENNSIGIHLKIDTGMHRLGLLEDEISKGIDLIKATPALRLVSIFSHLAASEDSSHDAYSFQQIRKFKTLSEEILAQFDYEIKRHILNSAGIVRFTGAQYDWVRLGIGMYGVDTSSSIQDRLVPVSTLKTKISQIKKVKKGNTVGYGRKGELINDVTLAILPIGYADGFDRRLSNGKGEVFIKGKKARVVGNICMDLTMVDVSYIDNPRPGDEVEIFGKNVSLVDAAARIGTIPYELLTNISERVKRIYVKD